MREQKHLDAIDALNKIEVLAAAAGYLTEEKEKEIQLELIDRIEVIARRINKQEQGGDRHA
ncbi:hypothetical protein [Serratia liquefaciens]|uniref:hypothetical protein n=1 Tax=Serratia liquefaciens TaxID=614 RepID=UPI00390642AE